MAARRRSFQGGWAFAQLGYFGDDHAARGLAKLVRVWPGENQHKRAVAGLDILASIGTDIALMQLYGLSQKGKFKALLDRARTKVDEIAARRKLTTAQLGDRLIPDLGLDTDGATTLELGDKSYRVVFDEQLRPFLLDGTKRLADLPKLRASIGSSAGSEAATATVDHWKALRKDAKTIATQQLQRRGLRPATTRLDRSSGLRWSAAAATSPSSSSAPTARVLPALWTRWPWRCWDSVGSLAS